MRAAYQMQHCAYCGSAWDICRDHVIPTSYLREKRRYEGDWLVPSCRECNSTLGNELIFNVPDRAYWLLQAYKRKHRKILKSIPWSEEELEDIGPTLRSAIESQEKARNSLTQRINHLRVISMQPITYLAPLRPIIDPDIEDVPEFMDNDIYRREEKRIDLYEKARKRFKKDEMQ